MPLLIYAIVLPDRDEPAGVAGALSLPESGTGHKLESLACRDVRVLFTPVGAVGKNPHRDEVLAYAEAIDRMASACTLLPMRYGSTAASAADLVRLIERNYDQIMAALQRVRGKAEYTLRVLRPSRSSDGDLAVDGAPDLPVPEALSGGGVSREYLRKKYRSFQEEAAESRYAEKLRRLLQEELARLTPFLEFGSSESGPSLLEVSLLVDASATDALLDFFGDFKALHPDLPLLLSGPWPPYHFATFSMTPP